MSTFATRNTLAPKTQLIMKFLSFLRSCDRFYGIDRVATWRTNYYEISIFLNTVLYGTRSHFVHVAGVRVLGKDECTGSATIPMTLRATLKALREQSGKLYCTTCVLILYLRTSSSTYSTVTNIAG